MSGTVGDTVKGRMSSKCDVEDVGGGLLWGAAVSSTIGVVAPPRSAASWPFIGYVDGDVLWSYCSSFPRRRKSFHVCMPDSEEAASSRSKRTLSC